MNGSSIKPVAKASFRPAPPRRSWRNYLLDRRLQLKYTAMVLAVTVTVATLLGAMAYRYSQGQTEALSIQIAMQPDLNPEASRDLKAWSQQQDRGILAAILAGIAIFSLVLGVTTIVVTHRLVGPVYRLKAIHREVAAGKLRVHARIRKGDELQDFFESFELMINSLRARQSDRLARIDAVVAVLQDLPPAEVARQSLAELRDELSRELDS